MKKTTFTALVSIFGGIGAFNTASAHIYWLEPNEFYFYDEAKNSTKKVSTNLNFEFSGSDHFFNADVNRANGEESEYRFRVLDKDGKEVSLASWQGKTKAVFEAEINKAGTYALEESRIGKPMYFTELQNDEWVKKPSDKLTKDELARKKESVGYYQYTKAFSTIHTSDDTWQKPLGQKLEIMPLSHPNKVYVGDALKVQLLYEGEPLANTKINLVNQDFRDKKHDATLKSVITDKDGMAAFKFKSSGRYLIFTEHRIPLENDKHAEALDFRSSLMLQVNEKWLREFE